MKLIRLLKVDVPFMQGLLAETAKRNGMSGKRSLAQALVWTMARDREEGLLDKKNKVLRDNANECR